MNWPVYMARKTLNKKSSSSFGVTCSVHKNTQQEKVKSPLKAVLKLILEFDTPQK